MISTMLQRTLGAARCAALGAVMLAAGHAQAQDYRAIYLPPSAGATPASMVIEAEAKYVVAQGYFLESAANARKINAEAVAKEIENWPKQVDAYFEGRKRNRQWREEELGGSYLQQLSRAQQVRAELMQHHFDELLKRDPVDSLNWLLVELSGPTMAVQYMIGRESLRPFDAKLDKNALQLIYVTDGGRGNSQLVFPLSDTTPLATRWPYLLRAPEFDDDRQEFDTARDELLQELQKYGQANHEKGDRLMQAVNSLLETLDGEYPHERRKASAVFLDYFSAKSYLQSLVAQVHRALNTQDSSVFKGSLAFQGETVLDLIQYMYQNGVMFHKGKREGGERVYRNLLENMRNIYLTLGSERAPPEKNPPEKN